MASPEEDQQDSDNSLCIKELENNSLACGSYRDLVSSKNPTPSPAADPNPNPDLLIKRTAIVCEFMDTIDSVDSDDDVSSVYSVCSNLSIQPKKERTLNVVFAVI